MIVNKTTGLNWKLIFIMIGAYITTNINLQGFFALLPFIQIDFDLSRAQVGLYSTFFFGAATLFGIFCGRFVDIIGSCKGLILGTVSVGVLMLFHSLAPVYLFLLVLAFFSGLGFSLVAPAVNRGVMNWISIEKRAVSLGIIQTGVSIGGFLGASLLPLLGSKFGWRTAVLFPGVFALAAGILIFKLIGQIVEEEEKPDKVEKGYDFTGTLIKLVKNKYLLYVCIIGFVYANTNSFIITHFTLFLSQDLGWSKTTAGFGLGILQIGGLIGQPGWGWLDDRLFKRDRVKGIFSMGLAIAIFTLFFGIFSYNFDLPFLLIWLIIFLLGISALGWMGLNLITVSEIASKGSTGTAIGLYLVFVRLGLLTSPALFGYLSDLNGNYQVSWVVLGAGVFLASVLFKFINNRR